MTPQLSAHVSVDIDASPTEIWRALTDPKLIKKYMFGTNAESDWKKGSPITYTGVWEGKQYKDKGKIIEIEPEHLLHTTYLSGLSNKEDKPENYANVIYEISGKRGEKTRLSLTQDNIQDDKSLKHMEQNWTTVLTAIKKMLEEPAANS